MTRLLPDRPATWMDVAAGVLSAWLLVATLRRVEALSLPAAGLAFAATLLALGPLARSALGERAGAWFDAIGFRGRGFVILGFAAVVLLARDLALVPSLPVESLSAGVFLAVVAFVPAQALAAGGVAGWRA
ncbi:hypothetical protein [Halobacterium litoreum]|uniref:Uncharacterized protein n=1 Tax=Halobacterium litoreum TaxID=2039234 RepID=A0ABD5NE46_9EURY|nr:hypothetical protein [Halobacterium litoreum]UHH13682.1 hypothetical protein LT972_01485 [Halobacterium litoreum]